MKLRFTATLCAALVAGAAQAALPPTEFVMKAGASDLYEITSSKLVMKSTNPTVHSFAAQMVTDHTKSTAMVKAAAIKSGLHPMPPKLEPKQLENIAALKQVSGSARDMLYVTQQKAAHQDALALHQDNAGTSSAPALKMASEKIVPVVEHHIMMLGSM